MVGTLYYLSFIPSRFVSGDRISELEISSANSVSQLLALLAKGTRAQQGTPRGTPTCTAHPGQSLSLLEDTVVCGQNNLRLVGSLFWASEAWVAEVGSTAGAESGEQHLTGGHPQRS